MHSSLWRPILRHGCWCKLCNATQKCSNYNVTRVWIVNLTEEHIDKNEEKKTNNLRPTRLSLWRSSQVEFKSNWMAVKADRPVWLDPEPAQTSQRELRPSSQWSRLKRKNNQNNSFTLLLNTDNAAFREALGLGDVGVDREQQGFPGLTAVSASGEPSVGLHPVLSFVSHRPIDARFSCSLIGSHSTALCVASHSLRPP